MSSKDLALTEKMEALAWKAAQKADPGGAAKFLTRFRQIPVGSNPIGAARVVDNMRSEYLGLLQSQGRIPDFWTLRRQARKNLGM